MFSHGDDEEEEVELQRKLFSSNPDVFSQTVLNSNIPKTYSQGTKSGTLKQFYAKSNFKRKII